MALSCKIGGVQYAGLQLMGVQIGLPDVKTQTVSVPGADGELDLTDALTGEPVFGNRTIKLKLGFCPRGPFDFYAFAAAVHGQRQKLELDGRDGYYIGRCTVGTPDTSQDRTIFDLTINADPYRFDPAATSITIPRVLRSANTMLGKTPTLSYAYAGSGNASITGSGVDCVLSVRGPATRSPTDRTYRARFKLPWPAAGSCLISADVANGYYEITDADGTVYGDGQSRWISNVPADALYVTLYSYGGADRWARLTNIQIYKATPGSLAGLSSDRLLFPAVDGVTAVSGATTIIRCARSAAPVTLQPGETISPYLSMRRTTDYAYAVCDQGGTVTLAGTRGWM